MSFRLTPGSMTFDDHELL